MGSISTSKPSEGKRAVKDEAHGPGRRSRLGARSKEPAGEQKQVVHTEIIPGSKGPSDLAIFDVDIVTAEGGPRTKAKSTGGIGGKSREYYVLGFKTLFQAAPIEQVEIIKRGVGAIEVVKLALRLETTKEKLIDRLGFSRATIDRKAKGKQNLTTEQGERVVGLAKLIGQVQTMIDESGDPKGFDAAQWVGRWLEQPNQALGGKRPAEFMDTVAGQEIVSGLVAQMQTGAYA